MSDEHFTVDGTLIEAWASQKSFQPKDGPPAAGGCANFHGQGRSNVTQASTTGPDAKLYRKPVARPSSHRPSLWVSPRSDPCPGYAPLDAPKMDQARVQRIRPQRLLRWRRRRRRVSVAVPRARCEVGRRSTRSEAQSRSPRERWRRRFGTFQDDHLFAAGRKKYYAANGETIVCAIEFGRTQQARCTLGYGKLNPARLAPSRGSAAAGAEDAAPGVAREERRSGEPREARAAIDERIAQSAAMAPATASGTSRTRFPARLRALPVAGRLSTTSAARPTQTPGDAHRSSQSLGRAIDGCGRIRRHPHGAQPAPGASARTSRAGVASRLCPQ